MKTVIGIDPSSIATGASVYKYYENGDVKYKTHYLYTTNFKPLSLTPEYKNANAKEKQVLKRKYMETKIVFMCKQLLKLFHSQKPAAIIIEDVYAQNDINTLKWFSRIQGVVLGYALENNIKCYYVSPTNWRRIVGIKQVDEKGKRMKRARLKAQAMDIVKKELNMDVSDDEADSILIGSIYL